MGSSELPSEKAFRKWFTSFTCLVSKGEKQATLDPLDFGF